MEEEAREGGGHVVVSSRVDPAPNAPRFLKREKIQKVERHEHTMKKKYFWGNPTRCFFVSHLLLCFALVCLRLSFLAHNVHSGVSVSPLALALYSDVHSFTCRVALG